MVIDYASKDVAEALQDERVLKRKVNPKWIRSLQRRLTELESASNFASYLRTGAGWPHPIHELGPYGYAARITGHVRLIFLPVADDPEAIRDATRCIVKGVAAYHGKGSISWYLP